ncbi:MAG TPA: helix-turn-helix domain-containing protein [Gammaproteobacteria bacterium]|nr:helix-turn-helix domain-containing protein [Gammaproteobacteria bacterium]
MAEINSFGDKLRLARERRGLSQEEAAKALCLNVEVINALECEQFDKLPSAVFVRGYIKNYASLLRLTINEPSRASTSSASPTVSPTPETKQFGLLPLLGRIFLKLLNYVVIITLAVLVFIWWHERHHAIEKNDATRSIISMSVEEVPFGRIKSNEILLPIVKKDDLMQDIFPGWPL